MSAVTLEQLKEVLDEKLRPLREEVSDLRTELNDATAFLNLANQKYEEILKQHKKHEQDHNDICAENSILRSTVQTLEQRLNQVKDELNDTNQYLRRECLEIQGIPVPKDDKHEDTNAIVIKLGKLMGLDLNEDDISTSHRLPANKKSKTHPKIIAKFVRRDVREKFYRARTKLKTFTTKDLDYSMENPIYINESLTEKNKELFRDCLKAKKDLNYSFIWTNYGKIYMRKSASSESIHIKDKLTLQKISV